MSARGDGGARVRVGERRGAFRTLLGARLRDTRGFMLAEQLVSVIFLGLLGIMVTAGIGAALSVYGNITRQATADNLLSRAVEAVSDELAYATGVEAGDEPEANPIFISGSLREEVQFADEHDFRGIWLHGTTQAVNLVPAQSGLVARLDDVRYYSKGDAAQNIPKNGWTFRVSIVPADNMDAAPLAQTTMTVKRIG